MTVASGLTAFFTAEMALHKGEGCKFDLARWLETLSTTAPLGWLVYIPVENQLELRLGNFPVLMWDSSLLPEGFFFFVIRFLFNYLFDWLQPGKHCFCWAEAFFDWGVDSTGNWERTAYHWRGPCLSKLPHAGTTPECSSVGKRINLNRNHV